jgi:hypothetical protein
LCRHQNLNPSQILNPSLNPSQIPSQILNLNPSQNLNLSHPVQGNQVSLEYYYNQVQKLCKVIYQLHK